MEEAKEHVPARDDPPHRIRLRTSSGAWAVWRSALLRTTGFPVDGLDLLAAPECAAAADAYLAGGDEQAFDKHYAQAMEAAVEQIGGIARNARFQEALCWQNRGLLDSLPGLAAGGSKTNHRFVRKATAIARYWQRYCAKTETVSFFGPSCWVRLDDQSPVPIDLRAGSGLVRERHVGLEPWALSAVGDTLAADPRVRPWLRPVLQPQVSLRGRTAVRPMSPPAPLSPVEYAALAAADGTRNAKDLVAGLDIRSAADGYLLLDQLVQRGLLRWDADLPLDLSAGAKLAELVAAVPDAGQTRELLDRLDRARDQVAAATGDAQALRTAIDALDVEFTAVTGTAPGRRPGQMYAGRSVCFEDTSRDLDLTIGGSVLDELAAPLELLLVAARWLCGALAEAYSSALGDLYDDLASDLPAGEQVSLADLWFLAQGLLFGAAERPVDAVMAELVKRWEDLYELDRLAPDVPAIRFDVTDLAGRVATAFPDRDPGWSAGRLHSPDLQICATDVAAIERGDYLVVLGELHVAWATFDAGALTLFHPRPGELVSALTADLGEHRVRLLYPPDWPRAHGRIAASLASPSDLQLGIAPAPGADRSRLVPAAAIVVEPDVATGTLTARAPDGRCWSLLEMFAGLLAVHAVDAFKLTGARPHTPRITIGRLVVSRETWRTTIGETRLARVKGGRDRYLAARRWQRRLGLPDRVFVKLATEVKPVYVDFRSPLYVLSLCTMLAAASTDHGDQAGVMVSEMLPGPEQAWVTDATGHRYLSELRIQVSDLSQGVKR